MQQLTKEELLEKLKKHSAVYLGEISDELLRDAGLWECVALLPNDYRERLKHMGNLFAQMCFNVRCEDTQLKAELVRLATSLSYLLNSSSFISDEYKSFDRSELDRKLGRVSHVE